LLGRETKNEGQHHVESPWVLWRLGGLDLRDDDCLALTMVEEVVDLAQLVPLRGVAGDVQGLEGQRRR
jgi:hypothetical protein